MKALLQVSDLQLPYPLPSESIPAPRLIQLQLSSGEFLCLTGPSGSGKSTLLKVLCGLENFPRGNIFYKDLPISEYPPQILRRELQIVFQTPLLLGPTVLDDLLLGLNLKNQSLEHDNSILWGQNLLKRAHLPASFISKKSQELSVGEGQRVALARSLALQPKILLLDEPTAALDPNSKRALLSALKEEVKRGLAILMATHDISEAQEVSSHGLELHEGHLHRFW